MLTDVPLPRASKVILRGKLGAGSVAFDDPPAAVVAAADAAPKPAASWDPKEGGGAANESPAGVVPASVLFESAGIVEALVPAL